MEKRKLRFKSVLVVFWIPEIDEIISNSVLFVLLPAFEILPIAICFI